MYVKNPNLFTTRPAAIITLLLLVCCSLTASAYTISGSVTDGDGEAMISASLKLLSAKDSTVVKTGVSSETGRYRIDGIAKGRYILEASYVGYNPEHRNVTITDKNITLKPITLTESSVMLAEATVVGIKTPIKVMEDTVEFNADTYKTQPNAVVEDLLKRLPGVEVDSEGKITANGKEVTKILVDGKEFFSDDPKVASKNLPVNMVDKLQVVDRKSDLARMTGVDDGEDETVINLTVKKGMKNGWFGNAEAGYGTDSRYKGSFNINRFWNDNQITFIGGLNNVNDLNFTDGTSGRFRRFGGTNGITASRAFGVNFNIGKEEIFRVGGDVMYSESDRDTRQSSDRQNIFPDSTSYVNSSKYARDKGRNLRADFRIQWNPDSFNTLEIRPSFSWNRNNSNSLDSSLTRAGNADLSEIVRSINRDNSRGTSIEFGTRLIYNHKFRSHPGRSFSIFANYRHSNVRERSNSYSWNRFALFNDSIDLTDQYGDNHTWSDNVSARVSWTEPLGDVKKGNFLTVAYRIQYRWNNADRLTYDHPVDFPDGWEGAPVISDELIYNPDLSNRFRNDYFSQDIRVGYRHVTAAHNVDVGMSLVPQMSRSINLEDDSRSIPSRWVWNYAPYLRYRWKVTKTRSFNLDYMGRSSQPSMTQLQPVADMSDPLRVIIGNPNLDPTFTHHLRLRFQDFQPEAQRAIMAMLDAQVAQNSIVSRTTYNSETGGQTTTYENVNGSWNVRAMNMISFPFRNRSFTFNNHVMLFYTRSIGFNNNRRNSSGSLMAGESFGIAWRPDNVEIELRPFYNLQNVTNSLQSSANHTVHTYGGALRATYYTPFGLVLNSDLSYSGTSGYSQGYDTDQWMWNASISYQFLRDRSATISLQGYDLVQQRSNVRRNVTANYIDDTRYNSLTRYFMVTFSYKFNTFGKGGQPRDRNARRFGPGGPGGPPHGR